MLMGEYLWYVRSIVSNAYLTGVPSAICVFVLLCVSPSLPVSCVRPTPSVYVYCLACPFLS
jgi:hypothetical protein